MSVSINCHKTTALNKQCCYNTSYNRIVEPVGGKLSDSETGAVSPDKRKIKSEILLLLTVLI